LGVLVADRTPNGHRRYGPDQVTRLFRALALRRAGIGLRHIASLLDEQGADPATTLRSHLAELNADLRRRAAIRDRLAGVLAEIEEPAGPGASHGRLLMKVIETMTMFEQYVHGYQARESRRLGDQAGTLQELLHRDTDYPSGASVLEVGCGVGAQTVALAARNPGVELTCIDVSPDSLELARSRVHNAGYDNVTFVQADVFDLPYPEGPLAGGLFDHAFVCFLLEHLERPVEALARLQTMLKPGGTITVIEGDHGSTYFHPDSEAARAVIDCQVRLQRHAGGDALIGRRLYPMLVGAGYRSVAVSPRQVYVDASRPELVDGFIRNTFTAMIEGIRQPAIAAGLIDAGQFDRGICDLLRTTEPDGVFCYTFFKATASS
jgi:ubiquinone/menaquinone biosynthesis C-methylase UbiE